MAQSAPATCGSEVAVALGGMAVFVAVPVAVAGRGVGEGGAGVLVGGTEVVGTAVGAGVADVAQADTKTQTSTELNIRKITFFVFILEHSPLILKGSEIFDSQ